MAPPAVNPYLRKPVNKTSGTSSQPPAASKGNSNAVSAKPKAALTLQVPPTQRKQQAPPVVPSRPTAVAASHPVSKTFLVKTKNPTSSQPPPAIANQRQRSAMSAKPEPPPPHPKQEALAVAPSRPGACHLVSTKHPINKKKPKSFKSQLKQQIENIKRAKEQEKQRLLREQVEAKREAERQELLLKQQEALEKQRKEAQERERIAKEKDEQAIMQRWRDQQQWMTHGMGRGMFVPSAYRPSIPPASRHVGTAYPVMIPTNYVTPAKVALQSHGGALALKGNARSSSNQVTPDPLPAAVSSSEPTAAHRLDPTTLAEEVSLTKQSATYGYVRNALLLWGSTLSSAGQITPVPCKEPFPDSISSSRSPDAPPCDPTHLAAVVPLMTQTPGNSIVEIKEKVVLKVKPNEAEASTLKGTVAPNVPAESELRTDAGGQIRSIMPPVIREPAVASTCWDSHARASSTPLPFAGHNIHLGLPNVTSTYATPQLPFPPYGLNPYPHTQMFPRPWMQCLPPKPIAPPLKPKPQILNRSPLDPPSPYAESHQLLREDIVIHKSPGESFGVILKFETQSTLVDPEVWEDNSTDKSAQPGSKKDPCIAGQATAAVAVDIVTGTDRAKENSTDAPSPTEGVQGEKSSVNTATTPANTPSTQVKATSTQVSQNMVESHVAPTNVATSTAAEGNASSVAQLLPAEQRRRRRRRLFFGVLKVVQAEQQNARIKKSDRNRLLQPGDIILKLNGHDVGGLTFQQACDLFDSCHAPDTSSEASVTHASTISSVVLTDIWCPLVVARMKPRPKTVVPWEPVRPTNIHSSVGALAIAPQSVYMPQSRIPFAVNDVTNQVISGDFSNSELLALAQGALRCVFQPSRALGYEMPPELQVKCFQLVALGQRDYLAIRSKRAHVARSIEQSMKKVAITHWTSQWKTEVEKMGITDDLQVPYLSDAQRSALRGLPRPVKGCRCGSTNHEQVNDSKCALYRNLRALAENQVESEERKKESKRTKASNLNAVETAFKDRILKLKEETEREEEEARFVSKMEEFQVVRSKMAVFVPSFTAMILSAVAELSCEISDIDDFAGDTEAATERSKQTVASTDSEAKEVHVDEVDDDDDDDDDLPLMTLGKRSRPSTEEPETKRIKTQDTKKSGDEKKLVKYKLPLDVSFLAKVLRHISHTWGHLFKEPSDASFAWRWEVYHGQTSSGHRESKTKNPREVGSLSFETIRFALTDEVVSRLSVAAKHGTVSQVADPNDLLLISHLLSPERTGVHDEIMALIKMGVLRTTPSGCVVLTDDWYVHVDPLLLDDMEHWSKRADQKNKHCMAEFIRDELAQSWKRVDRGWVLLSDPDDVVFPDDEWDEWRRHFQDRHESHVNEAEGIEKFGI